MKVKNGFVPPLRRDVFRRFVGVEIDSCPFVNLPEKRKGPRSLTKEDMQKCIWLRPELVAQIEFRRMDA